MNRAMKTKNDKRKREEMKAKKAKMNDIASHRFYAETISEADTFFWKVNPVNHMKMWWEV